MMELTPMDNTDLVSLRIAIASAESAEVLTALLGLGEHLRLKEGDASLLKELVPRLRDEDADIRRAASWDIGKLAQNRAIEAMDIRPLLAALKDDDAEVRENASWALGELAGKGVGGRESLPLLVRLLKDEETQTRGMAAWALGRLAERMELAEKASIAELESLRADKSQYVSKTADWALERIRPLAI
jgi:HEAT repeat protein